MSVLKEKGYHWLDWLPDGHQQLIAQVRTVALPVLSTNLLPHFTDHSIAHSDRIINLLGLLLEENLQQKEPIRVSDDECLIVVLGALLHDVGMQLPKAHGLSTPAGELTPADLGTMRANHGKASGVLVRNAVNGDDSFGVQLPISGFKRHLAFCASLCENHQSSAAYDPTREEAFGTGKVRVGFLTALLRMADQLDCDSNRVRIEDLQRFDLPPESVLRWLLCHYVDAVTIRGGVVKITASFPKTFTGPIIDQLSEQVLRKTQAEHDSGVEGLWPNYVRLRLPKKIVSTGEDLTYKKAPLPPKVEELLVSKFTTTSPMSVVAAPEEKGRLTRKNEPTDFMSYWGFVGNPFLDRPVSYGNELFVETPRVMRLIDETAKHLAGKTGDLRLVIGGRGMGKTTLFQTMQSRFGAEYDVQVIDVADRVISVRSALELYQTMLKSVGAALDPESDTTTADRIIGVSKRGRKKIVCIDSLDRLPPERRDDVRDFFKIAQRFLTEFRSGAVMLISCSEAWANLLGDKELNFLGNRNRWELEPFGSQEIREMLERRIKTSGTEYAKVFDPSCAAALFTLSAGNPRTVLAHAEAICREAAQKGQKIVSAQFIRESYRADFDKILQDLVSRLGRESPAPKKAIDQLYMFYLDLERRNLDTNDGWRYLLAMLRGELTRSSLPMQFYPPMRHIALPLDGVAAVGKELRYKPLPEVRELFSALRKDGVGPEDFVSFYGTNPFPGGRQDTDTLVAQLSLQGSEEHIVHFERARQAYLELRRTARSPPQTIRNCWDCIEEFTLAILVRHGGYDVHTFEKSQEGAFYTDKFGVRRVRENAGPAFVESALQLSNDLRDFLKARHKWLTHWNGLQWLLRTRNNIVKSRPEYLAQYTDKERDLGLGHLEALFKEMLGLYEESFAR